MVFSHAFIYIVQKRNSDIRLILKVFYQKGIDVGIRPYMARVWG